MKLEDFTLRQVAVVVPLLGFLDWAISQFLVLPSLSNDYRQRLYPGWASTPYPYALSFIFIAFAAWFVFAYRGRLATHGRRIVIFAMALGALSGMAVMLAIRLFWHI